MKTIEKKDDWHLKSIHLYFQDYGEDKGTYKGTIEFENGESEGFKFRITPKMAHKYINLISKDIVKGASSLGTRLLESLKSQGLISSSRTDNDK